MSKPTTVIARKKPGPKPTGKGKQIVVRMQPDNLTALDKFIADESDSPSRPEAVRRILNDWLVGHGYKALSE